MYTIEQLRDVIKTELDKQEYVEEPYSLSTPWNLPKSQRGILQTT